MVSVSSIIVSLCFAASFVSAISEFEACIGKKDQDGCELSSTNKGRCFEGTDGLTCVTSQNGN